MANQICLKWNSFLNNIATSFESLWEEEGLVDVTLASDGQCLTAHKVILSASSPFFKKVFQTNPCQHPVIILQDVHFAELEALLIFIYKGEVNIEEKKLPALLKAAETLQIRGLSGNDSFAKDAFTKVDQEESFEEKNSQSGGEEPPSKRKKKKQKKAHHNPESAILEAVLTPRRTRSASFSETSSEKSSKETEVEAAKSDYDPLEMKVEPFDVFYGKSSMEDLDKPPSECDAEADRLIPESPTRDPGTSSMSLMSTMGEAAECHATYHNRCSNYQQVVDDTRMISGIGELMDSESQMDINPGRSHCTAFPSFPMPENSDCIDHSQTVKGSSGYPPFPCPFCDRAYTSWGFRRRHIKAVHTISPSLNCKWCSERLPTHAAWKKHVISCHSLSEVDAHNGLLILEEAHMVLQSAHPTKLDTLVNIIKQSSQASQSDRLPPD